MVCGGEEDNDHIVCGYFYTPQKSYSISYDMNGHGEVPTGVSTSYDKDTPLPYNPPAPVNVNGYTFNGWSPK